jgi:hypothetical protein
VFIVWQVIILLRFLLQQTRFDIPLPWFLATVNNSRLKGRLIKYSDF